MTIQNDESLNYLPEKHAYQMGVIHAILKTIRIDLNMGHEKEAIAKINEALKFMELEIVPAFYMHSEDENQIKEINNGKD